MHILAEGHCFDTLQTPTDLIYLLFWVSLFIFCEHNLLLPSSCDKGSQREHKMFLAGNQQRFCTDPGDPASWARPESSLSSEPQILGEFSWNKTRPEPGPSSEPQFWGSSLRTEQDTSQAQALNPSFGGFSWSSPQTRSTPVGGEPRVSPTSYPGIPNIPKVPFTGARGTAPPGAAGDRGDAEPPTAEPQIIPSPATLRYSAIASRTLVSSREAPKTGQVFMEKDFSMKSLLQEGKCQPCTPLVSPPSN